MTHMYYSIFSFYFFLFLANFATIFKGSRPLVRYLLLVGKFNLRHILVLILGPQS